MTKTQILKVVGKTANRIDPNMDRLEKFDVFCRVCDSALEDFRITQDTVHKEGVSQHYSYFKFVLTKCDFI